MSNLHQKRKQKRKNRNNKKDLKVQVKMKKVKRKTVKIICSHHQKTQKMKAHQQVSRHPPFFFWLNLLLVAGSSSEDEEEQSEDDESDDDEEYHYAVRCRNTECRLLSWKLKTEAAKECAEECPDSWFCPMCVNAYVAPKHRTQLERGMCKVGTKLWANFHDETVNRWKCCEF